MLTNDYFGFWVLNRSMCLLAHTTQCQAGTVCLLMLEGMQKDKEEREQQKRIAGCTILANRPEDPL